LMVQLNLISQLTWKMTRPGLEVGDLVEIVAKDGWTVCLPTSRSTDSLSNFFLKERKLAHINDQSDKFRFDNRLYESLEGKVALITKANKNRLEQMRTYEILIDGRKMMCKSIVGEKYFKVLQTSGENYES